MTRWTRNYYESSVLPKEPRTLSHFCRPPKFVEQVITFCRITLIYGLNDFSLSLLTFMLNIHINQEEMVENMGFSVFLTKVQHLATSIRSMLI